MPSNKKHTARAAIAANTQLSCSVQTCTNKRTGMSRYCKHHKNRLQKYGNPAGTSLYGNGGSTFYRRELEFTHELLLKNASSKPVQAAVKVLRQWIDGAKNGWDVPSPRLIRLIEGESPELPILVELTAAYIHIRMRTAMSDKETVYALANALYRHVPKQWQYIDSKSNPGKSYSKPTVKIGPRDRQAMGQYIMEQLGVFLVNVFEHYKSAKELEASLKHQMAEPL